MDQSRLNFFFSNSKFFLQYPYNNFYLNLYINENTSHSDYDIELDSGFYFINDLIINKSMRLKKINKPKNKLFFINSKKIFKTKDTKIINLISF